MSELYGDWEYIEAPTKKAHSTNTGSNNVKEARTEVLWVNYSLSGSKKNQHFQSKWQF